jgi:hypothetical protein
MTMNRKILTVIGIAALALPAYTAAKPGNGHAHGKAAKHIFKGTYAGDGIVTVDHGNAKVRRGGYVGQDVAFDLTNAKITVADTNADGVKDAADVVVGDRVLVGARLAKDGSAVQPFPAKRLVDKTNPPEAEEDEGDDEGDGEGEVPPPE